MIITLRLYFFLRKVIQRMYVSMYIVAVPKRKPPPRMVVQEYERLGDTRNIYMWGV